MDIKTKFERGQKFKHKLTGEIGIIDAVEVSVTGEGVQIRYYICCAGHPSQWRTEDELPDDALLDPAPRDYRAEAQAIRDWNMKGGWTKAVVYSGGKVDFYKDVGIKRLDTDSPLILAAIEASLRAGHEYPEVTE